MTIDELKEKGLDNTESIIEYYSRNINGLYFLPGNLAELIAEIAKSNSPKSCINLNSNIGEILSKCDGIEKRLGVTHINEWAGQSEIKRIKYYM